MYSVAACSRTPNFESMVRIASESSGTRVVDRTRARRQYLKLPRRRRARGLNSQLARSGARHCR
jgi:hypothetical protein